MDGGHCGASEGVLGPRQASLTPCSKAMTKGNAQKVETWLPLAPVRQPERMARPLHPISSILSHDSYRCQLHSLCVSKAEPQGSFPRQERKS